MAVNVGLVGATGLVGEIFLKLLEERNFPVGNLKLFASENSAGLQLKFKNKSYAVETLNPNCFDGLDLVFFSSGDPISKEWAPKAAAAGAWAIDNSAAFRMDPKIPLVVPEVNFSDVKKFNSKIIANPNCTTIQMVVALKPLSDRWGLRRVQVASYQAVSGAGKAAQAELESQMREHLSGQNISKPTQFAHTILSNCIPQIGGFDDEGFCTEEQKVMRETQKILNLPKLSVSAFTVRVPVLNAHSEALWVEFEKPATADEVRSALLSAEGISLLDDPKNSSYPHARMASGADPVYVGRVVKDPSWPHTFRLWVVADNLRKGAALNGIQIAEKIF